MTRNILKALVLVLMVAATTLPGVAFAGWSTTRLTNDSAISETPSTAIDSSGKIHAVWTDSRTGKKQIWYKKFDGVSWGSDMRLTDNSATAESPSIVTDGSGNLYLVWQELLSGKYEVYFSKSTNGGTSWSTKINVSSTNGSNSIQPSITVGPSGNIHVVWTDDYYSILYKKSTNGGVTWTGSTTLALGWYYDSYDYEAFGSPKIISTSNGSLNVSYSWYFAYDDVGGIYLARSTNEGSSWSSYLMDENLYDRPPVLASCQNNIYMAWISGDGWNNGSLVYIKSTDNGSTWGSKTTITAVNDNSWSPVSITAGTSEVHIVWAEDLGSNNYDVYYTKSTNSGSTWQAKTNLSSNSGTTINPALPSNNWSTASNPGNIHVLWQDTTDGNPEIYDANYSPAATYTISGKVTIQGTGTGIGGVIISYAGGSTTTDPNGNYTISGLSAGSYTLTPSAANLTFSPSSQPVTVGPDQTINFQGTSTLTYSILGKVTIQGTTNGLGGVNVSDGTRSASTDASGNYAILNVPVGSYTVSASKDGWAFTPPSRSVTISTSDQSNITFEATQTKFSISGRITIEGTSLGLSGATISYGGGSTVSTDSNGYYTILGLSAGTFTLTPSKLLYGFTPASRDVIVGPDKTNINFMATLVNNFTVSGKVSQQGTTTGITGVTVTIGGFTATTVSDGTYSLSGVPQGTYTATPSKTGWAFIPASRTFTGPPNQANVTFEGTQTDTTPPGPVTYFTASPGNAMVTLGWTNPTLDYTGTLIIRKAGSQPTAIPATGINYSVGTIIGDAIVVYNSNGTSSTDTGLSNGTTYYYKAFAYDAPRNYSTAASVSATPQAVDTTPPTISSVTAGAISTSGATITWQTNENSTSSVEYGTTISYGSTSGNATPITNHLIPLSGLAASTTYHFRVRSTDAAGNTAASGDYTFTTLPSGTTYFISGTVTLTGQSDNSGVTVTCGTQSGNTDSNGAYTITGVPAGSYSLIATKIGWTINPSNFSNPVTVNANLTDKNFTGTQAGTTYFISGTIRDAATGTGLEGVIVQAGGYQGSTVWGGVYTIEGVSAGTYNVTPQKENWIFAPTSTSVAVGPNATGKDFTGTYTPTITDAKVETGKARNHPNPFNPDIEKTKIIFSIDEPEVKLAIYDLRGKALCTKFALPKDGNYYEVEWDGKSDFGHTVSNGTYLYLVTSGGKVLIRGQLVVWR